MKKPKKTLLAISLCLAWSAQAEADKDKTDNTNQLPEIVVYAQQNSGLSSSQKVTAEKIKSSPNSNGNISDFLKTNSNIRFERSDESSHQRGEIKPAEISINGAEASQTSYFVDNVNVNNDLGFGSDIFEGHMANLPMASNAQAYFFDANLLSSVTVYDSDVSASLGGFAGGAVVAKTKQYDGTDGVQLRYRTSNSRWAKFHIDEKDREKFERAEPVSNQAEYQPKYSKHFFSISAQKSLTDKLGMVAGFSRRTSDIQQRRLVLGENLQFSSDKQNHKRRADNALLNFNYLANEDNRFELSLRYSNYLESKFFATNLDSNLQDYHQAYGATLAWIHSLKSGVLTNTFAYDEFKDKRKSASTHMDTTILTNEDGDSEEYSRGGMGNSSLKQTNLHFSSEYAMDPFAWGSVQHSISLGGIYQFTKYRFQRDQNATAKTLSRVELGGGLPPFEDSSENKVPKGTVQTSYQNIALYAEDLISWKNFEFRPGVRLERDNFLKNTNIAPRFVARWKPFEETKLSFGANRYYGRSFAAMKLSEGIFKLDNLDNQDGRRYQSVQSMKTPFTDELSLGVNQQLGNFIIDARYIHRKNKKRIVLRGDDRNRRFEQGKDYSNDVYTLQIQNMDSWKLFGTEWTTSLGFDWLDTKGIDVGVGYDPNSLVILDGKLMSELDMRSKINNHREEWMARVGIDMRIPNYNIEWTNRIYVKAPIKGVTNVDDHGDIPVYRSYNHGTHTQWDTSIRWQPKLFGKHSVFAKVDVLNVLNKTRKGIGSSGEDYGFYAAGREFWLELGYEF
ncbi:TonB-dependent receptor [Canicola haemoglobinophilus]|uniref:TonB-dependent receptor n=1 Tax=Canicola haemoglobinophilus TaxID=733 RepID=A0A1V4B362_9PAST|nr:TonB-dependent receptor plug domain-containing protein [Canicola haemoglobinophilus]OOS01780.1 TonB-dependent receptor [Canicola haemoglobinophilus]STO60669.1 TonB-dependent receptor [Canicola haemoglobinophilus]